MAMSGLAQALRIYEVWLGFLEGLINLIIQQPHMMTSSAQP